MLRDMVRVMDAHGDGLIPTAPVLEFLRQEAGLVSDSRPPAERRGEQVIRYILTFGWVGGCGRDSGGISSSLGMRAPVMREGFRDPLSEGIGEPHDAFMRLQGFSAPPQRAARSCSFFL